LGAQIKGDRAGYIASRGVRNSYKILVGKPQKKKPLEDLGAGKYNIYKSL
jgi:hypothetical protein